MDEQLAPAYEGVELGIGDAVLLKAIQGATGRSAKDVRANDEAMAGSFSFNYYWAVANKWFGVDPSDVRQG